MPAEQHTVKFTRNFERSLSDIVGFLEENEASSASDLLLDEIDDTAIPKLESFPKMGRRLLDSPALAPEARSQRRSFTALQPR